MSQFSYFCDSTDYWIPVLLYSFTVDISFICSIQANHRSLLNLQKNSEMHRIKSLAKQSPHPSTMPSVIPHGLCNWGLVQGYIRPTCAFLVASFCLWENTVNLCTPSFYVLLSTMSTMQWNNKCVVSKGICCWWVAHTLLKSVCYFSHFMQLLVRSPTMLAYEHAQQFMK